LSCSEEDAISAVLVKVKPLMVPNTTTDAMLAAYTHWYMCCTVSARTSPTSHVVLLPWGPQIIFGMKQQMDQELASGEALRRRGIFQRIFPKRRN
jgi:hypothetical protein